MVVSDLVVARGAWREPELASDALHASQPK
jgi:hypothetical protein